MGGDFFRGFETLGIGFSLYFIGDRGNNAELDELARREAAIEADRNLSDQKKAEELSRIRGRRHVLIKDTMKTRAALYPDLYDAEGYPRPKRPDPGKYPFKPEPKSDV